MSKVMFKTPIGTAMYPHLNKPDTQFDSAGKFKTNLKIKKDDAKALVETVKKAAQEAFGDKAKTAKMPFKTDEDTGDLIAITSSKFQPKVVDSQGNTVPPHRLPEIFGGSKLILGGNLYAYNAGGSHGISLQLGGVQIIELSDSINAQGLSFDKVENGFVAANDDMEAEEGDYNF